MKGLLSLGFLILHLDYAVAWVRHTTWPRRFPPSFHVECIGKTAQFMFFASKEGNQLSKESNDERGDIAHVVRLSAKEYHPEDSKPSSRQYTTRKVAQDSIFIDEDGVKGDYNHYRTVALSGTKDRAVSILTTDILKLLHPYGITDGDLGENILVSGVDFRYFVPGKMYVFSSEGNVANDKVVLEITEAMIPCANLCKLPCINDESKSLPDRVKTCQAMIDLLETEKGLRGWYAKVVEAGRVNKNSTVYECSCR